jgi:hypothetical protein
MSSSKATPRQTRAATRRIEERPIEERSIDAQPIIERTIDDDERTIDRIFQDSDEDLELTRRTKPSRSDGRVEIVPEQSDPHYGDEIEDIETENERLRRRIAVLEKRPAHIPVLNRNRDRDETEINKELIKLIPNYSGTGGIQKLLQYIKKVEVYVENSNHTPEANFRLAIAKLTDDAAMWWLEQEDNPDGVKDWEGLKSALKREFVPVENDEHLRDKPEVLQQTGSIAEYNTAFRRISLQITDLPQTEAKRYYKRGLKTKIRDLMQSKDNINTVRDMQLACLKLDTENYTATKRSRDEDALVTTPIPSKLSRTSSRG